MTHKDAPTPAWYVISGGPSSGKSTTIALLAGRGFHVTTEKARQILDEEMAKGRSADDIRGDGEWFQELILERELAMDAQLDPGATIFLDRGIPDGFAYERYLRLTPNPALAEAARVQRYRRVFVLDPLHLHDDGSRIEDEQAQQDIHDAIVATYGELGFDLVQVPVLPIEQRVEFILARID